MTALSRITDIKFRSPDDRVEFVKAAITNLVRIPTWSHQGRNSRGQLTVLIASLTI
ncbi:hypothetical protein SAMN05444358_1011184 [Ruegeria halocynthiae]|uniref:Uncharacterized protein n=1 Tax=Ruegeria halocynthiae TaxID=985054 RepID=A0A1H2UMH4_9RHOB|nr:hypothetical protein SAMN05444358_1011184 [Ruegeria halocynthiae]